MCNGVPMRFGKMQGFAQCSHTETREAYIQDKQNTNRGEPGDVKSALQEPGRSASESGPYNGGPYNDENPITAKATRRRGAYNSSWEATILE